MRITSEFAYDREDIRCLECDIVELLTILFAFSKAGYNIFRYTLELIFREGDGTLRIKKLSGRDYWVVRSASYLLFVEVFLYHGLERRKW